MMIRHLTRSSLHVWDKADAVKAADEQIWEEHDTSDDEDAPVAKMSLSLLAHSGHAHARRHVAPTLTLTTSASAT